MAQDTLNSILHIKSGVESNNSKQNCEECKSNSISQHCHCCVFELSDRMKEECKYSWRKCEEKRKAAANQRVESNDKLEARRKEFEENEAKKFERVKGKILKNPKFYTSNLLLPVFYKPDTNNNVKKRKGDEKNDKSDSKKSKTNVENDSMVKMFKSIVPSSSKKK